MYTQTVCGDGHAGTCTQAVIHEFEGMSPLLRLLQYVQHIVCAILGNLQGSGHSRCFTRDMLSCDVNGVHLVFLEMWSSTIVEVL